MSVVEQKIGGVGKIEVAPAVLVAERDKRPIRGAELIRKQFANIFLAARKESGKSTIIYNLVKALCAPWRQLTGNRWVAGTKVYVFCGSLKGDPTYASIRGWCKANQIKFSGKESLGPVKKRKGLKGKDGVEVSGDDLDVLIAKLRRESGNGEEDDESLDFHPEGIAPRPVVVKPRPPVFIATNAPEEVTAEEVEVPSEYREINALIIIDDLSDQLKRASVLKLLKSNRHCKCKVIVSSQYLNDATPDSRGQMDTICVFKGLGDGKLEELHESCGISTPFEDLKLLYRHAAKDQFSFLTIDPLSREFRKGFSHKLVVT
jgi:hypothetical protein